MNSALLNSMNTDRLRVALTLLSILWVRPRHLIPFIMLILVLRTLRSRCTRTMTWLLLVAIPLTFLYHVPTCIFLATSDYLANVLTGQYHYDLNLDEACGAPFGEGQTPSMYTAWRHIVMAILATFTIVAELNCS